MDNSSSSINEIEYIDKYITPINSGNDCIDITINELVYPQIFMFCQIQVHYQVGNRLRNGSYKFTYGNWNEAYQPQVFLNGSDTQLNPDLYQINYKEGIIIPKYETASGDNMICSYNFSWFTHEMLQSYVKKSLSTINYHGQGSATSYTIDDLPQTFYGISADLVVAMCCETLILSYTMWVGKLIFAISSNDLYGGGGDVTSQLQTIKHNCEDRAYGALENERLRAPHSIALPTPAYWKGISLGMGVRQSKHGKRDYGKIQGIKVNRYLGGFAGGQGNDLDV